MGSFKGFKNSEVFLTDYVAQKEWNIQGKDFWVPGKNISESENQFFLTDSQDKILVFKITVGTPPYYVGEGFESNVLYDSINQLFYRKPVEENPLRYDIDQQTTITVNGSRELKETAVVLSIPRAIFGTNIGHRTVHITLPVTGEISDREGVLINQVGKVVGDIIYEKGLLIFTDENVADELLEESGNIDSSVMLEFRSNLPVYTYNFICEVSDKEDNYTYNPSAKRFLTMKDFTPYVTTVGLYNSTHELLAVAKLSKPIKKAPNVTTTYCIRLDL